MPFLSSLFHPVVGIKPVTIMQGDIPSKKKIGFKVNDDLKAYLEQQNRYIKLPVEYEDLSRYMSSLALLDAGGNDTLWETVYYPESDMEDLNTSLTEIYAFLKTDGDVEVLEHLSVARIDFCTFGNTHPFRVRVVNKLNDNFDHFYVKKADSSRIYGLELENLLSPNSMKYLVFKETMIEEHVSGIPGDDFIKTNLDTSEFNDIRIAKEFIKFNERCFVRLLGDMRSYNYVVDITPDIDGNQYRLRAIDFDQQSYEGRKSFYLPQFFKENNPIIFLGIKHMSPETVKQYQLEERSLIAFRINTSIKQVTALLNIMALDTISFPKKVEQLRGEMAYHHKTDKFDQCKTMGQILIVNLQLLLKKDFKQSIAEIEVGNA
jgi:hypothetical protein